MTATPTTTGFDPYRAWLNVRSDKRPLSAYGILGLKDLESNHTLIKNAANRKRYVLNKHKPDADPDIWERLRRELDDGVVLLLDRDRKRLLDASLLRQSPSLKTADAPTSEGEARDITCSKCEQCNAGNQRFCSRCGGPLWQTCPTCGVELTTQDSFCGRCGTDVGAALAEEDEECVARIDEAMQLRAEHRFAGSIKILRAIARTANSRLDRHARRALELIQELEQEQAQHVRQAEEQLATARERFEEYDYDAVVATLNDVPVTSRGSEMKSLFQEAWTRRGRVEKLLGEVKSLVERNDVVSLARTLDELLDIKPDLTQIQPLTGQVRDRICAMAEKKMRAYAFDQARELLDSVPASTRNEVPA